MNRLAGLAVAAAVLSGCGGGSNTPPRVGLTISQQGPNAVYQVPSFVDGGVVDVALHNETRSPADAQLIRVEGDHGISDVLKVIGRREGTIPDWLRAQGGPGLTSPGRSSSATVDLPAGAYFVVDDLASGKPASAQLTVNPGKGGKLPGTLPSVTAAAVGKGRYQWQVSGLHAGANRITFNSGGANTLHDLVFARLKGNPSVAEVKRALVSSNVRSPLDQKASYETATLDSGSSEVTTVTLEPGRYVLLCLLHDRNGRMPHFLQGLARKVVIGEAAIAGPSG